MIGDSLTWRWASWSTVRSGLAIQRAIFEVPRGSLHELKWVRSRTPQLVLEDVLDELISAETAVRDYGVVVHDGRIDWEPTRIQRETQRR